jgi:hypothetical protein
MDTDTRIKNIDGLAINERDRVDFQATLALRLRQTYGSEISVIQSVDLSTHLRQRQLAIYVACV